MRSKEFITELFNQAYDWDRSEIKKDGVSMIEFTTDSGETYEVVISSVASLERRMAFSFAVILDPHDERSRLDPDSKSQYSAANVKYREQLISKSKGKEFFRVFSTVIEIVKAAIQEINPQLITFSGASEEPSRIKLYDRFAKLLQKEGWKPAATDGEGVRTYTFTRP